MNEHEYNLPGLPTGWVWTRLDGVIDKIPLTGKKLKQSEYKQEGKIPVIDQGQTFIGGYTDREELKISCDLPLIIFGDHTKVVKYVNFDFVAGADGVKVLKPLTVFYPKLFYYVLQAMELPDKGYARHFQFLEKSLIPLPPLPEQRRIVAKIEEMFTKLDAGVEALKKVKAELKRYRQAVLKCAFEGKLTEEWRGNVGAGGNAPIEPASVLLEKIKNNVGATLVVAQNKRAGTSLAPTKDLTQLPEGWVWTRLEELAEINPKFNGDNISEDMKVTFLPMKCVEELTGHLDLSLTKKLAEVKKGYTPFVNGDLLFAKITPCMENGKVAIAHSLKNGIGFGSTEFHVIRLHESFFKKFFFFFLIREDLRRDAKRNMTGSAGQLRVPINYMKQMPIPFPPLPEQHQIVEEIERRFSVADEVGKVVEQSLRQAERMRQSILKKAFEGNLVPQDPGDEPAEKLLEQIKAEKVQRETNKKGKSRISKRSRYVK
jgi:Restriction endonuclease S subunits